MLWRESVETALARLGGVAPLATLYAEVQRVRATSGDTVPTNLEAIVRRELEHNSSDSTQWLKKRDLFFSVHGKGLGVWGLRKNLTQDATAIDLSDPVSEDLLATAEITVNRIIRDTTMSRKVKALHQGRCQICSTSILLPDGRQYAEGHHVVPLGRPHFGPDDPSNIIVVCPHHHAMLDLGCIPLDPANITSVPGHTLATESIAYHNSLILRSKRDAGC